jgi:hypothetical protein
MYGTPGPEPPDFPVDIEARPTLDQDNALVEHSDHSAIADDAWAACNCISEVEIPRPSHQPRERHMLIETISSNSMLWDCPGRGLHTMDEEDVVGADDELLAPLVISSFIEDHISGARTDVENLRMKSAVVKYLGATILLIERKCSSQTTILEYLSEFLDVLEGGPGALVSILQQLPRKPTFQASEHSDVFALYHEVLTLLRTEFRPTTQVVARICALLADLEMLYPEISHHAEVLYGVAIQAYEEMGSFDHLLQCQLSLANVLIDLNRTSDAYELLARASGKYIRDHLDFWFDGKLNTKPYELASLFPQNPGVRPSIFRIKHILSKKDGNDRK